jgi:transcription antitermination factor NusB
MGRRRRARESAIQVLFHLEFSADDPREVFDLICENFRTQESIKPFSAQLVQGVCEKREELDALIIHASNNWRLERMARLDKCILRLAAYEMMFMHDIPPKVSIDEAVDLGKTFGGEDSGSFINGILDNIYNTLMQQGRLETESKTN